ncbi:hypothetical protein Tco_1570410 [Tanacetum coccineum]
MNDKLNVIHRDIKSARSRTTRDGDDARLVEARAQMADMHFRLERNKIQHSSLPTHQRARFEKVLPGQVQGSSRENENQGVNQEKNHLNAPNDKERNREEIDEIVNEMDPYQGSTSKASKETVEVDWIFFGGGIAET